MNWQLLKELRLIFLGEGKALSANYWTEELLKLYDQTFAERIGWKWDAVLGEVKAKGWLPPVNAVVVDWGCGTGIATRKFLSYFSDSKTVYLFDKNRSAVEYARQRIQKEKPAVEFGDFENRTEGVPFVLLVSHVLNELSGADLQTLVSLCKKAETVFWVEPGTHILSRKLISIRETLRVDLSLFAPCPHQENCPVLKEENAKDWCHHFASPPKEVFQTGFWSEFARELGIDLRSLPVSYFVATKEKAVTGERKARVIGRARMFKGFAEALVCESTATLSTRKILKRDGPALLKQLKDFQFSQEL